MKALIDPRSGRVCELREVQPALPGRQLAIAPLLYARGVGGSSVHMTAN